jgi:mono/diheme cytochrome c family protein
VKAWVAALGLCAVLLVASIALAQQEKSLAENRSAERSPRIDASVYSELAKAPEKARLRPNPLSQDPTAIAAGRLLFERHCAQCHGDSAEGKKGPSLRAEEVQSAAPGALFWILTNGVVRRGMPVWSRLPEPQRWQLVAYIRSLAVKPTQSSVGPD